MMKQRSLFSSSYNNSENEKNSSTTKNEWKLYIDGASRGNPGEAGAGICLYKNAEIVVQKGFYLCIATNNYAEYAALLLGLYHSFLFLPKHALLQIYSDSLLLVQQMKGLYKVKNEVLQRMHARAKELLRHKKYTFIHVLRIYNQEADRLANEGIDKKIELPKELSFLAAI